MRTVTEALRYAVLRLIKESQLVSEAQALSLRGLLKLLDDDGWCFSFHSLLVQLEAYERRHWLTIQSYKGMEFPNNTVMITPKGLKALRRLFQ